MKACALESRMCSWDELEPWLRLLGSTQGFPAFIVRKSQEVAQRTSQPALLSGGTVLRRRVSPGAGQVQVIQ